MLSLFRTMQRETYDAAENPEEVDGMETYHPYRHTQAPETQPTQPSYPQPHSQEPSRDTDKTFVERKSRTMIGSAFDPGEQVFRWV
jgi:hypothetical protein